MSLATRQDKAGIEGFGQPVGMFVSLPFVVGTIDLAEQLVLLGLYSGLEAGSGVPIAVTVVFDLQIAGDVSWVLGISGDLALDLSATGDIEFPGFIVGEYA